MKYLLWLLTFIAFERAFLWFAMTKGIGATVTERSSHTTFTPTCGGIIVPLALIVFSCIHASALDINWWMAIGGALLLAAISLYDDIRPLDPWTRLIAQTIVMAVTFQYMCYPQAFHIYLLVIIIGVGATNTINFIDGITGMLGFYTIVTFSSFAYALYLMSPDANAMYIQLCIIIVLAMAAFLIFNIPDKIFAGDVGAITIGFLIVFVCVHIALDSHNASVMIFLIVAVFDAGLTTLQRLFAGENILMPHREFIYEVLTSRWRLPHIVVSLCYALLQLLINALYFLVPVNQHWTYFIAVFILLTFAYFAIRRSPKSRIADSNTTRHDEPC